MGNKKTTTVAVRVYPKTRDDVNQLALHMGARMGKRLTQAEALKIVVVKALQEELRAENE